MTFCDISNVFAEVNHLFQWTANLHTKKSPCIISILISITFLFTFEFKLFSILRKQLLLKLLVYNALYISLPVPLPPWFYNIQLRKKLSGSVSFQTDQLKTATTFSIT